MDIFLLSKFRNVDEQQDNWTKHKIRTYKQAHGTYTHRQIPQTENEKWNPKCAEHDSYVSNQYWKNQIETNLIDL